MATSVPTLARFDITHALPLASVADAGLFKKFGGALYHVLLRLARDFGMTVIAEGIETVDQVQALLACGVEEGQGYLISPPLPFAKFDELLEIRRSGAFAEATLRQPALVA